MKMHRITSLFTAFVLASSLFLALPSSALADEDTAKVDESFELFWAKRRNISAYENQKFKKDSHWEVTFNSGVVTNDDFYLFVPLGLSGTYFLTENLGVELEGTYFLTMTSDLATFLELGDVLGKLPRHEKLVFRATANVLWSPIHGKLGVLASKLFHYDIHFSAGFGAVGTTVMDLDPADESRLIAGAMKPTPAGQLGIGFRFWLNEDMAVRAGYRQYFNVSQLDDAGITMPAEVQIGFSYFTGGVN
jgi:outer membrane beta-barrel protein